MVETTSEESTATESPSYNTTMDESASINSVALAQETVIPYSFDFSSRRFPAELRASVIDFALQEGRVFPLDLQTITKTRIKTRGIDEIELSTKTSRVISIVSPTPLLSVSTAMRQETLRHLVPLQILDPARPFRRIWIHPLYDVVLLHAAVGLMSSAGRKVFDMVLEHGSPGLTISKMALIWATANPLYELMHDEPVTGEWLACDRGDMEGAMALMSRLHLLGTKELHLVVCHMFYGPAHFRWPDLLTMCEPRRAPDSEVYHFKIAYHRRQHKLLEGAKWSQMAQTMIERIEKWRKDLLAYDVLRESKAAKLAAEPWVFPEIMFKELLQNGEHYR